MDSVLLELIIRAQQDSDKMCCVLGFCLWLKKNVVNCFSDNVQQFICITQGQNQFVDTQPKGVISSSVNLFSITIIMLLSVWNSAISWPADKTRCTVEFHHESICCQTFFEKSYAVSASPNTCLARLKGISTDFCVYRKV